MKHIAEDGLIAYHLQESVDTAALRAHLEQCTECAALSESVAETLRVFSAEPVPPVNVDHAWQRLRAELPATRVPAHRPWWQRSAVWPASALAVMLCLAFGALLYFGALLDKSPQKTPVYAHNRQGPLTQQPTGINGKAGIANQLDSAERLLTEVNHTTGPLDESTRLQARTLLLTNAVYVQQAHAAGELGEASLLEQLGRVLITLEHPPAQSSRDEGWHVRFEMSTSGLLLDLRVLQQNDHRNDPQQKEAK